MNAETETKPQITASATHTIRSAVSSAAVFGAGFLFTDFLSDFVSDFFMVV